MRNAAFIFTCLAMFAVACGPTNPKREPPVESFGTVDLSVAQSQAVGNPKVDILFVIDNSLSMEAHQVNLARNIDGFVGAFAKNASIDFHIAAVPIYDSKKFGTRIKKFYPLGQLLPLRNPADPQGPRLSQLPPYLTADIPDYVSILKATLIEGTAVGPEFEESFSPVVAALTPEMQAGPNRGFYRSDAHLVVVFLTDADDSSPNVSADELYSDLLYLKNNDAQKISSVGVIVPIEETNCPRDPSGPPFKIVKFLTMSGGSQLSLCSADFGQQLAQIGNEISEKVGRQVVKLSSVPEINSLEVKFGSQTIPKDPETGWAYNPRRQEIILSGKMRVKPEPGAKIKIHFTPVKIENQNNGRTKSIGH